MNDQDSEKEHNMSGLRESYERMKQSSQYEALPEEAKEQLAQAITDFEFAIQTEYDPCKKFVLEAMHQGDIDDIEALANDDDLGEMVRNVADGAANVYRSMVSHLMKNAMAWAMHLEQHEHVDVSEFLEMLSEYSKACVVTDYVMSEVACKPMDAKDITFGVAQADGSNGFMIDPDEIL